jgi:hypothetical protein
MVKRSIKLLALLAAAVLLAACSAPATSVPEASVRPISEILASEAEFRDIGPVSAAMLVETTVPAVCAVVYGTTPAYGQIATDMDMAGGAHSAHRPLLTGLSPDTLYYARLQGVGPDGTLYRSEEYTFRTAPAAADDGRPNLALPANGARVVGVSSSFGSPDGPWGPRSAFDGDGGSAWSSAGDGDQAWIELELADVTHVGRIGFWTRTMGSSAEVHSFRVVTDSGEIVGPFMLGGAAEIEYFETDFTARRLRFEAVTTSGGNTGAVEIEVYAR